MREIREIRHFTEWFLVTPAEDLPGAWTVHCLETDVVSQGESPRHAFEMGMEAVEM